MKQATSCLCISVIAIFGSSFNVVDALATSQPTTRRDALTKGWNMAVVAGTAATFLPKASYAAEDNTVLSDDEMAARIARKMELLKTGKAPAPSAPKGLDMDRAPITDIRSDVNPEAGVNLRSRSTLENAKVALEKQKEMNNRDKAKKREDMCEMLGRGC